MTAEQLVALTDAATDRIRRETRDRFDAAVNAHRLGTVFAHNMKAWRAWLRRSREPGQRPVGLSGANLERAVMALRLTHPDIVAVAS